MKIIVGAVLSRYPFVPGSVWNRLHRILGFQRLGHEVYVVEELSPKRCVDRSGRSAAFDRSINRELFMSTLERFGLTGRGCQIYNKGEDTCGLSLAAIAEVARNTDLLVNMSGHVSTPAVFDTVKRRIFVDEDPVYTQLWHAAYGIDQNLSSHDAFFSAGLNIGTPECAIPDCGVTWRHTLPPVILEYWETGADAVPSPFTTIASWSDFGDLCHEGVWYRSKAESFKRLADLPGRVDQGLEVALGEQRGMNAGSRFLKEHGWRVTDSRQMTSLDSYRDYVTGSRAEIGVAKHAYVEARSGWFSDRSAHYLAGGRPVLAESTGLESRLPVGRGLLTFSSVDEAADAVGQVNADYRLHCRAAREFAEAYLDYRRVLPIFLEQCAA